MNACLQLTEYYFLASWMLFMSLTTISIHQGSKWLLKNIAAGCRKSHEGLDSSNKCRKKTLPLKKVPSQIDRREIRIFFFNPPNHSLMLFCGESLTLISNSLDASYDLFFLRNSDFFSHVRLRKNIHPIGGSALRKMKPEDATHNNLVFANF